MTDPIVPQTAPAAPSPAPVRRARHPWRWIGGATALVVLLIAIAVGGIAWALTTTGGTAWVLQRAPGVTVVASNGALIGDFSAERLDAVVPGTGTLRLERLAWQGLRLSRADAGRWLRLSIKRLHVDRVLFTPSPAPASANEPPRAAPRSLRLPVEVIVRDASVGELLYGAADAVPVRALHLSLHLGAEGGTLHRADALAASYDKVVATGSAQIAADAPFAVTARIGLHAPEAAGAVPAFRAGLAVVGPLARLDLAATVRVDASATHAAQSADLGAVVLPFAAWPIGSLQAATNALDLSAFVNAAPATALTGRASIASSGLDRPARVSIALTNARAGRIGEGLLPVRRIDAALRARPADPSVLDLQSLAVDLGSEALPGGSLRGSGRWAPAQATLDLSLDEVRPTALDARAPQTTLDGTVQIVATGMSGGLDTTALDVIARVDGQLLDPSLPRAAPRNARLRLEARAASREVALRAFEARLGAASVKLSGKLTRDTADAPWRAVGQLAVADFDPAPWWPGAGLGSPTRGPTRDSMRNRTRSQTPGPQPVLAALNLLNAAGSFDLVLPSATGASPYDTLGVVRGKANLSITGSMLAGVPLEGKATFTNTDGRAQPTIEVSAAGNRLSAAGSVATKGSVNDRWQLTIDAPQLERLAPLLALGGSIGGVNGGEPALGGALRVEARVDGRWPDLATQGELAADAVRYGDITVRRAESRWQLSSADNAPLDATLALDDLSTAGRAVQRARVTLAGTARAHNATLRIESQALPPAWVDTLVTTASTPTPAPTPGPRSSASRSEVVLTADGGLVDAGGQRLAGWRGRIGELAVRSTERPGRTWFQARDVRGSVVWGDGPLKAQVEPGRAEVLGATLRWSRVGYSGTSAAAPAKLDLQAVIDPLAVVPILQQLQPGFGWSGDLAVGARIDLKSTPEIHADIVLERARGDLAILQAYGTQEDGTQEDGTQQLGLSALRAAVTADNGVWRASARVAGSSFGSASADVTARAASSTTWPEAATPLAGALDVRFDDLGTLSSWTPAGWRLGGALRANAVVGGRLGAPTYTGRLEGAGLSARNFLQGVDMTNGELLLALNGDTARIEKFTAQGGNGSVSITGSANLGATPTADLRIGADKFQLLGRVDRRIVVSGAANVRLDAKAVGLTGRFKVDEGLVDFSRADAPTLGNDVEVVRRPRGTASPAAETQALAATPAEPAVGRQVSLDLRVDVGERLRIRGRGLDASLRGEMHITSPEGRIAIDGSIRAVDGSYQAYGQKLGIDRAVITFVGPLDNPRLDIEATRPGLDVRVGVVVTGTVLSPRVRLFSEPAMSDVDKLSWLVLGKASTATGGNEAALLQRAALGLLSGEGPGVTDRITKALGLDELSVRSGAGGVKDTIVSVGKQISKRWYVGYEQGLNSTAGSWQLIYRLAQRFTVKAQAGGDNAVDVNWTLRWK